MDQELAESGWIKSYCKDGFHIHFGCSFFVKRHCANFFWKWMESGVNFIYPFAPYPALHPTFEKLFHTLKFGVEHKWIDFAVWPTFMKSTQKTFFGSFCEQPNLKIIIFCFYSSPKTNIECPAVDVKISLRSWPWPLINYIYIIFKSTNVKYYWPNTRKFTLEK